MNWNSLGTLSNSEAVRVISQHIHLPPTASPLKQVYSAWNHMRVLLCYFFFLIGQFCLAVYMSEDTTISSRNDLKQQPRRS